MLFRFALFASAALALVLGGNAHGAALVYGTYYDESNFATCSNTTICRANFSQTPADKLLMVTKVACQITSTAPAATGMLHISTGFGGGALSRYLPLAFQTPQLIGSLYFVSIEANAHFLVGQGRFPFVTLTTQAPANITSFCTIVGDLVTPIS